MTFDAALDYLLGLPRFADQGAQAFHPGLSRMTALLDAMGRPQDAYPCVHLAGTNGKGSTASLLAAVATASGRRTGLHTSPHLFHLAERLRADGVPAPERWIAGAVDRFRAAFDRIEPSFFEATTAFSLLYFAERNVELAIIETGLGGRLDATNVVRPLLSIVTNVGLEHTDLLGTTLPAIAREKAGIIKPGTPVLTAAEQPEVLEVLAAVAESRDAPLRRVEDEVQVLSETTTLDGLILTLRTPVRVYDDLHVSLPGRHQRANAALAVRAAEMLFDDVRRDPAPVYRGLHDLRRLSGLRGRLDVLRREPLIVADVGHNPDGLRRALEFMHAHRHPAGRLSVALGLMRDKDAAAMAARLAAADATVIPVRLDGARALPGEELATVLRGRGVRVKPARTAAATWAAFLRDAHPGDALLFTGSHQVVACLAGPMCDTQLPS